MQETFEAITVVKQYYSKILLVAKIGYSKTLLVYLPTYVSFNDATTECEEPNSTIYLLDKLEMRARTKFSGKVRLSFSPDKAYLQIHRLCGDALKKRHMHEPIDVYLKNQIQMFYIQQE